MAHQAGFENVVGGLGTALTAGQVELVTRYAPRIALAYDVDAGGAGRRRPSGRRSCRPRRGDRALAASRSADRRGCRAPARGQGPRRGHPRRPGRLARGDRARRGRRRLPPGALRQALPAHDPERQGPAGQRHGADPPVAGGPRPPRAATCATCRSAAAWTTGRINEKLRQPGVAVGPGAGALRARGVDGEAHVGARINLDAVMATPDALDPQSVTRALEPVEADAPAHAADPPGTPAVGRGAAGPGRPYHHASTRAVARHAGRPDGGRWR